MTALSITDEDIPDLSGKTAVVTGGSSGIGLGAVEIFLEHGARVFILDVQPLPPGLGKTATYPPTYIRTDISSWPSLVDAFAAVTASSATLDIAVGNAGVESDGGYLQQCLRTPAPADAAAWAALRDGGAPAYRSVAVNLVGTLNFVMLAARVMKAQPDGGRVVLTGSATAYLPEQSLPVYCATKAAVTSLIRSLRATLPQHGISISGVAPSATESATLPAQLAAPLVAAGLPVSTGRHVGLAVAYSATARQARRVEDYGRDEPEKAGAEAPWNGRVVHTLGDTYTEVEEALVRTRPRWWGQRNEELARAQQRATDMRYTLLGG
ncbi:short chain dehydrogenase reductase [Hypoxylon sp. FL1284]|nr:short chain dehydrogenase reductase [Hypoxylon sp. FL1284]